MDNNMFEGLFGDKEYTIIEIGSLPPLVLAYIGDSVYEVFIRDHLIRAGGKNVNNLHKSSISFVNSHAQFVIVQAINSFLTDEEQNVIRRGRNANSHTVPKNADVAEYRYATGFEALIGYLYLKGDKKRLMEILEKSYQIICSGE